MQRKKRTKQGKRGSFSPGKEDALKGPAPGRGVIFAGFPGQTAYVGEKKKREKGNAT